MQIHCFDVATELLMVEIHCLVPILTLFVKFEKPRRSPWVSFIPSTSSDQYIISPNATVTISHRHHMHLHQHLKAPCMSTWILSY